MKLLSTLKMLLIVTLASAYVVPPPLAAAAVVAPPVLPLPTTITLAAVAADHGMFHALAVHSQSTGIGLAAFVAVCLLQDSSNAVAAARGFFSSPAPLDDVVNLSFGDAGACYPIKGEDEIGSSAYLSEENWYCVVGA